MAAYVIVEIEVRDARTYERYKSLVPATLERYGGRFIVRGGAAEALEGDQAPGRIVVLEFPDRARARAWWESPEYRPAREIRQMSARTRMILADGVRL